MTTLRTYLKSAGVTQKQFADRIGVTQAFVSRLCGDDPRPSLETALSIEAATEGHVPIDSWPPFASLRGRITSRNTTVSTQETVE